MSANALQLIFNFDKKNVDRGGGMPLDVGMIGNKSGRKIKRDMKNENENEIAITTIQRNAGDYLATIGSVCPAEDAEFFVVLQDDDKLENDEHGLTLTRKGVYYVQETEMNQFKEMVFVELTMDRQSAKTIAVKLIDAGERVRKYTASTLKHVRHTYLERKSMICRSKNMTPESK